MILVVTPNLTNGECSEALRQSTNEEIVTAASLHEATTLLRTDSYLVVVLDEYLLETESDETRTVMRHFGTAIPLLVNLAISGGTRLAREVRAALQRRRQEEAAARRAVLNTLRCELNGTVTSLLLSCELALGVPGLPRSASEQLESAHELVKKLRAQLESTLADTPTLQKAAGSAIPEGIQTQAVRPA
jgi:hypothetical protein